MDFKIIAISPLDGCSKKFLRVLKENKNYFLYNNYELLPNRIVEHPSNIPELLYGSVEGIRINISAIVGKNGTGKSSIIELLYAAIFNTAKVCEILPEKDDDDKKIRIEAGVKVDIYFKVKGKFYHLRCDGHDIKYRVQHKLDSDFSEYKKAEKGSSIDICRMFYTLVVNYSHYSLNTNQHRWLRYLFHKNDGYQTPIVINPYRKNGVIDINIEGDLTNARIAASLLTLRKDEKKQYRELAPRRIATHLKFTYNPLKLILDDKELIYEHQLLDNRNTILKTVFKYFPISPKPKIYDTENKYLKAAYFYICRKLLSITKKYAPYKYKEFQFINAIPGRKKDNVTSVKFEFSSESLERLLKKMVQRPSHITFKLRQAVNFVENINFYTSRIGKFVDIKEYADHINSLRRKTGRKKQEIMAVIPPSFFKVDARFEDKGTLETLSSGEKQKIYSSASWMYHLINLASVREERKANYVRYECINLVFDEIELYYHPEMQRDFINTFLKDLERLQLGNDWAINCIFITHSPFILSDIHNQNILFLTENGLPDDRAKALRTFGANIHELLKNHFLLEHGTIGTFAQGKIKSIMNFLDGKNNAWDEKTAKQFIEMVSEPLIRKSLFTMFNRKFMKVDELRKQIAEFESELKELTMK